MFLPSIFDCTLRDGGYYTNWDFDKSIVDTYIKAINKLPIECIEIGYRNRPSKSYLGKYGYCPVFELANIREQTSKRIAIMLNEKDVKPSDLGCLLEPVAGLVNLVRIAVDPQNFIRALILAKNIKNKGFMVGFNMMYMSKWRQIDGFIESLSAAKEAVDIFYMVDSFGGVSPSDVKETTELLKGELDCPIGFHGHNNLELGLINTLTAIDSGVNYVDTTVLGMGRGAGNLKTELLLTYLNKHCNLEVDFNILGEVVSVFSDLFQKYKWGTSLPYMLSGANSLPQKDIMEWIQNRLYSFNSIIRALDNKKENIADNAKYPIFNVPPYDSVLIIGGGNTIIDHFDGIRSFIGRRKSMALIYATARYIRFYQDMDIPQYLCLVGSEGKRLVDNAEGNFNGICVLPPYPRIMGTDVPNFVKDKTYELEAIDFTDNFYADSCTAIALQIALNLKIGKIYIAGYDGYRGNILSEKENILTHENRTLFSDFYKKFCHQLISLTPTLYKELKVMSLYQED
jgi:4-hydroxy 2-oxovalerate aldolase